MIKASANLFSARQQSTAVSKSATIKCSAIRESGHVPVGTSKDEGGGT